VTHSIKPRRLKFFLDELFLAFYSVNYDPIYRKRLFQDLNKLVVAQLSCGGEATGTSIKHKLRKPWACFHRARGFLLVWYLKGRGRGTPHGLFYWQTQNIF
jgi:hypothetical protein